MSCFGLVARLPNVDSVSTVMMLRASQTHAVAAIAQIELRPTVPVKVIKRSTQIRQAAATSQRDGGRGGSS